MNTNRRNAVAALIAAGLLFGTTVPLSKLALEWLSPGWLTAARFGLAAAVLLAVAKPGLRAAFTPKVLLSGALGYGGSVMVQNAGISRTSVTHAALLIGAVPVMVAIIAAVWHRTVARPVAWVGFVVSLGGVGLVTAGGGGGGATMAGDGLVLASLVLSATVTVAQVRLLAGRDPVAVTAVQFLGATVGALLVSVLTERAPALPASLGPVLAVVALAAAGTLLPFTLFAFGQSRVSAEVAGAFLNLEPLVGAIAGAVAFGDPVGLAQIAGGAAIVAGIGLSSLPLLVRRRQRRPQAAPHRQPVHPQSLSLPAAAPVAPTGAQPLALAAAEPLALAAAQPVALAATQPLALPAAAPVAPTAAQPLALAATQPLAGLGLLGHESGSVHDRGCRLPHPHPPGARRAGRRPGGRLGRRSVGRPPGRGRGSTAGKGPGASGPRAVDGRGRSGPDDVTGRPGRPGRAGRAGSRRRSGGPARGRRRDSSLPTAWPAR